MLPLLWRQGINNILLIMWLRRVCPDPEEGSGVTCRGREGQNGAQWSAESAVPGWDTGGCGSVPTPVTFLQEHSETITPMSDSSSDIEELKMWLLKRQTQTNFIMYVKHFLELLCSCIPFLTNAANIEWITILFPLIWCRMVNQKRAYHRTWDVDN